jgi:mRNA interferase MazF
MTMRRGEVWWVDLEPSVGSKASKTRPAVLVSNDGANVRATRTGRGILSVVPLTSNTSRVYPFQVLLDSTTTGLPRDSKAQAEQVRSVDVARFRTRAGMLRAADLAALDDALRIHLSL